MTEILKLLLTQPYQVLVLALGAIFALIPCVTVDKDHHWTTHAPVPWVLESIGISLLAVSFASFSYSVVAKRRTDADGLDLDIVKESKGAFSINISNCEITVVVGRIEEALVSDSIAIVLPCNEYFDDRCANDTRSALGAFVNRVFDGQVEAFVSLMKEETKRKLGPGQQQQKTKTEWAESYGAGRCVLLERPLNKRATIALVSTTTQRAEVGLSAQISCLFDGAHALFRNLADARIVEATMPLMGAGHGRISPSMALTGLILALAEAARYGHGAQRMRKVTVIVFKADADAKPDVEPSLVRRVLALVASQE